MDIAVIVRDIDQYLLQNHPETWLTVPYEEKISRIHELLKEYTEDTDNDNRRTSPSISNC